MTIEKDAEEINEALAKNPADKHLNSQLIKLGSAKICTIDSFYLDLLRSNFAELELQKAGAGETESNDNINVIEGEGSDGKDI